MLNETNVNGSAEQPSAKSASPHLQAEHQRRFKVGEPSLHEVLSQSKGAAQILLALAVDKDCLALQKTINTVLKLSGDSDVCAKLLPRELVWEKEFLDIKKSIDAILQSEINQKFRANLSSPVSDSQLPGFCQTLSAISWVSDAYDKKALDRLVVAIVFTAAANNIVISEVVCNGIRQCYKAIIKQSSKHWLAIALSAPATNAEVSALLATSKPGVTTNFLEELNKLFSLEIPPPPSNGGQDIATQDVVEATLTYRAQSQGENTHYTTVAHQPDITEAGKNRETLEVVAPSIRSMVRASQLCTLSTKLGIIYQWDFLSPKNLALLTRKIAPLVDHEDIKISAFATLALTSLQVRANAKSALLTPTEFADPETRGDLWIDTHAERLIWLHLAYMRETDPEYFKTEPHYNNLQNSILLSPALKRGLKLHLRRSGCQPTINAILCGSIGADELNLTEFNRFLRSIGDPAHVAEPTRFAHSLGPAILDITGSDMLAALAGLDFEVAAPAALYYYSPKQDWVDDKCKKVYKTLGL